MENKADKNGFWVSSDNNLYYQSNGIDLGEFEYFNVEKQCFGRIIEKEKEFFKDKEKVKHYKATYKEIIQIRKIEA